jgi:hypothetical protein
MNRLPPSPRIVAPLAILLLLASTGVAAAHGGDRVLQTVVDRYRIEVWVTRSGSMIDESVTVLNTQTGRPLTSATVTLTLDGADGQRIGPLIARGFGGIYEVLYPPQNEGVWTVLIEIVGPDGAVSVSHPYHTPSDSGGLGGRPGLVLNLLLAALVVAVVVLLPRMGRAARTPASSASNNGTSPH